MLSRLLIRFGPLNIARRGSNGNCMHNKAPTSDLGPVRTRAVLRSTQSRCLKPKATFLVNVYDIFPTTMSAKCDVWPSLTHPSQSSSFIKVGSRDSEASNMIPDDQSCNIHHPSLTLSGEGRLARVTTDVTIV